MRFHFNDGAMKVLAAKRIPEREGRLFYRNSQGKYKERWFKLQGNLLFYFRTNEFGSIATDPDPVGVFVLARYYIQTELFADLPFVFSLSCNGEEKHYFSGHSMEQCNEWISALHSASYDVLRMSFEGLRRQIKSITGKDPITEQSPLPTNYSTPSDLKTDKSDKNRETKLQVLYFIWFDTFWIQQRQKSHIVSKCEDRKSHIAHWKEAQD